MRLRLSCRALSLTLLILSLAPGPSHSGRGGLSTEFGEVRLQNLAIGKTYSVARMAAAPLVVHNTSDDTLSINVQVLIPARHELAAGILPLPDLKWVKVERTSFTVPARATVRTDVRLTLPYDPDLAGKTFQVDFWSRQVGRDGRGGAGQRHHLLFNVEMDYRDDTEATFSMRLRSSER